jgi:hypothetical protein
VPRRIEVPSADALFGVPAAPPAESPPPPPAGRPPAAPPSTATPERPGSVPSRAEASPAPRPRRAAPGSPLRRPRPATPAPRRVDLRRLDRLEAALADLPIDRLIEVREQVELLLAGPTVDPAGLRRLLEWCGA